MIFFFFFFNETTGGKKNTLSYIMSYLRVGQNVEMKVGCKYRERPMIKKKDVFIIMISCGLTYIGVMSVCMQEINERVVTKSTKKHLNQTNT